MFCLVCASWLTLAATLGTKDWDLVAVPKPRGEQRGFILGESSDDEADDPTVDEANQMRNTTEEELVPVDLEKMIEESKLKVRLNASPIAMTQCCCYQADKVFNTANLLGAQEVNASNVYARWDETKGELMRVNKRFPIEPIVMKRYPMKPEDIPNQPEDEDALAKSVGLKADNTTSKGEGDKSEAEMEAEMEATEALPSEFVDF